MLGDAVYPIADLRIIKTQAEQHQAHTGTELSYSQYSALLLSAAQQHDKVLMDPPSRHSQKLVYKMEQESKGTSRDQFL